MIFLASVIFGWVAFDRLPINLLPDISYPTLTVRTEYPGTAPGEVENLVSKPVEEAVSKRYKFFADTENNLLSFANDG